MRIQKYLSQQKIASRREAEEYIRQGLVELNGKIVTKMGIQIDPTRDTIKILKKAKLRSQKKTLAVYKLRGVVCSHNSDEGKTIFEVFPEAKGLNVVGRLDKESEGLLLLSNDGVITAAVTGSNHRIEKEYEVTVRESVSPLQLKTIATGIVLDGKKTLPAKISRLGSRSFSLIISEGRNHQIRRMAAFVHLTIERLVRIRIGSITIADLTPGKSRSLTEKEVEKIKN